MKVDASILEDLFRTANLLELGSGILQNKSALTLPLQHQTPQHQYEEKSIGFKLC